MNHEPVLKARTIPKPANGYPRVAMTFQVLGGLDYHRGNSKPYFSLTCWSHRKGFPHQCQSGGCDHETILKYYPQYADLAALHLSDIDGVPMHAESNAWYNLAGALPDNAGEKYHAGNSERNFDLPKDKIDPEKPWKDYEHRKPTAEECLGFFADHVRVPMDTAWEVLAGVVRVWTTTREACEREHYAKTAGIEHLGDAPAIDAFYPYSVHSWAKARAWFAQWIEEQKPRWKAEAEACIAHHGLRLYGDPWEPIETTEGNEVEA